MKHYLTTHSALYMHILSLFSHTLEHYLMVNLGVNGLLAATRIRDVTEGQKSS